MIKKITVVFMVLFLVIALPTSVKGYQLDSKFSQKINYLNNEEIYEGLTELNMEFTKDFGMNKKLYLNPVFKLKLSENARFEETGLNEKPFEDNDYDFLREGYMDIYLKNADIRVGKQNVDWGSAYELNPTDVINPIDFTAEEPTSAELGVPAVKTDYYFNFNTSLSGVLVTKHRASLIPKTVENMINDTAENMIYKEIYSQIYEQNKNKSSAQTTTNSIMKNNFTINEAEERKILDSSDSPEFALQLTRRNFNGYDLSLNYFKGYEDLPLIVSDYEDVKAELGQIIKETTSTNISSETTSIDFGYKKTQALGFSGRGSLGSMGVWTEINYNINEDEEKKLDAIIGGDYTFGNNLYTVAQLFYRSYNDYEINDILKNAGKETLLKDQTYLLLHGDIPFRSIHKFNTDLIVDLGGNGYMLNPEVELSLGTDYSLDLGAIIMDQDDTKDFSTLNMLGNEKTYVEFTWNF